MNTDHLVHEFEVELNYYKKQLNELAGSGVVNDYRMAEMHNEIRQMKAGFELIAALNSFKPNNSFDEIYDHFTEQINIHLQNDLSLFLIRQLESKNTFSVNFIKGDLREILMINGITIDIPHKLIDQQNSLLVNSQAPITPFIQELSELVQIKYFILTPIIVKGSIIAYLFTGRKTETILFSSSRLMLDDVHALQAIAGIISAFKNQYDQFEDLERERIRISGEMHDEIGSKISRISLLSEMILNKQQLPQIIKNDLLLLGTEARGLVQTMSDIIWALDPFNDTLENLVAYIREQAQNYFEPINIDLVIDFPRSLPCIKFSNEVRRNLYLVIIEGLNNAMKHSKASEIILKLYIIKKELRIQIIDNGIGIPDKIKPDSNGLRNMKRRMDDIKGITNWSRIDDKTLLEFILPIY